jgi:hypothetical protein
VRLPANAECDQLRGVTQGENGAAGLADALATGALDPAAFTATPGPRRRVTPVISGMAARHASRRPSSHQPNGAHRGAAKWSPSGIPALRWKTTTGRGGGQDRDRKPCIGNSMIIKSGRCTPTGMPANRSRPVGRAAR